MYLLLALRRFFSLIEARISHQLTGHFHVYGRAKLILEPFCLRLGHVLTPLMEVNFFNIENFNVFNIFNISHLILLERPRGLKVCIVHIYIYLLTAYL